LILFNLVDVELLRLAKAARRLGVHPMTLRQWALDGKIPVAWVGRERRFEVEVLDAKKLGGRDELLADFGFLVTACAGRLPGMRGAGNRRRFLAESGLYAGSGRVG
jgi:excisionase family DNA binding protein